MKSRKITACVAAAAIVSAVLAGTASPAYAATNYYVAKTGSDANAGSLAAPFLTIQKCATVAQAGDSCLIETGVYRETVTPANSGTASAPITFAPYNNEAVSVSGANLLSSWTQSSGNIYYASATLPVAGETADGPNGETAGVVQANQLFVNGTMAITAQWPNGPTDPSHSATSTAQAGTSDGTVVDSTLPAGINFTGALEHVVSTEGWTASVNPVSSMGTGSPASFNVTEHCADPNCNDQGSKYFLSGGPNGLQFLDQANEWWYDPSAHRVYLWAPGGGSPASSVVEYKQRRYAFDLSGQSYINVTGLGIFGASVNTSDTSTHDTLGSLIVKYVDQETTLPADLNNVSCGTWCSHESDTGIILRGSYNSLVDSDVSWGAANLVAVLGQNITVRNNLLHDGDWLGGYPSIVKVANGGEANISHNTIYDSGRFAIHFSSDSASPSRVSYNNIYNFGSQTRDLGAIYTCCHSGDGTRFDHNVIHDSQTVDKFSTGIFIDDSGQGYQLDHNVSWNTGSYGYKLNASGGNGQSLNNLVYNNSYAPGTPATEAGQVNDATGSVIENNVYSWGGQDYETGVANATVSHNLSGYSDPQYVNPSVNDYHLQSTSPAVNAGVTISGVTTGAVGAPDEGAYEVGGLDWIAGCDFTACNASTTPYLGEMATAYATQSGTTTQLGEGTDGAHDVQYINNGDWMSYTGLVFPQTPTQLSVQVASPLSTPGTIEAHLGTATGTLLGTCTVPPTGDWQSYVTASCPITGLSGTQTVVLVAKNSATTASLFNFLSFRFSTAPVTTVNPRVQMEAERMDASSGVQIFESSGSIDKLGWVGSGAYAGYNNVAFGATSPTTLTMSISASSATGTQTWVAHLGSTTGPVVATCNADIVGTSGTFVQSTCAVTGATGTQNLYMVSPTGSPDLDWFKFS
jgi:hypothetical protein